MAVADEVRQEEVMACVVSRADFAPGDALARNLFDFANEKLAYYKPPGWIAFVDRLPKTSTQKVQKAEIFPKNIDPRTLPDAFDLRPLKKGATRRRESSGHNDAALTPLPAIAPSPARPRGRQRRLNPGVIVGNSIRLVSAAESGDALGS